MLRTNLSTRPFYNERGVHAVAAIVALLVIALAAWQGVRIVRMSRYKTDLNTSIARDQAEAQRRRSDADEVRRGVNQKELARVMAAAAEANTLIKQRTFSWTELFNQLEATLPENVMLISIHPEFKDGFTIVNLELQGKSSDDVESFFDRLEKTGVFREVELSQVAVTEEGLDRVSAKTVYTPERAAAKPAAAVAKPSTSGGRK